MGLIFVDNQTGVLGASGLPSSIGSTTFNSTGTAATGFFAVAWTGATANIATNGNYLKIILDQPRLGTPSTTYEVIFAGVQSGSTTAIIYQRAVGQSASGAPFTHTAGSLWSCGPTSDDLSGLAGLTYITGTPSSAGQVPQSTAPGSATWQTPSFTSSGVPTYDVKAFGADGTAVMVQSQIVDVQGWVYQNGTAVAWTGSTLSGSDGVMSSTTNPDQFTSASTTFTMNDLGKVISVVGAGKAGTILHSCIISLIGAASATSHTVQLQNNCQTTVSAANFIYGSGAAVAMGGSQTSNYSNNYYASPNVLQDNVQSVFTGQHIGYVIRVKGAGPSGVNLVTTITGVDVTPGATNAVGTRAWMAAAASTDVTCADYTLGPGSLTGLSGTITASGTGNSLVSSVSSTGSTTFSDLDGGAFEAADINKRLIVFGAGGSGADLYTTVGAYTSATKVTAGTSVAASTPTTHACTVTGGSFVIQSADSTITAANINNYVTGPQISVGAILTGLVSGGGVGGHDFTISLPATGSNSGAQTLTFTPSYGYCYSFGGSMNATSNVLTDPAANFTALLNGRQITVRNALLAKGWGAGYTGATQTGTLNCSDSNTQNKNCNTLGAGDPVLAVTAYMKQISATTVGLYSNPILTAPLPATSTTHCATYVYGVDSAPAIQNALNAAVATGGTVLVSPGTFLLASGLTWGATNTLPVSVVGMGRHASTLVAGQPLPTMLKSQNSGHTVVQDVNLECNLLCQNGIRFDTDNGVNVQANMLRGTRVTETTQAFIGSWAVHFTGGGFSQSGGMMLGCVIENLPSAHQDCFSNSDFDGMLVANNIIQNVASSFNIFQAANTLVTGNLFREVRSRAPGGFQFGSIATAYVGNTFINCDAIQLLGQGQDGLLNANQLINTRITSSTTLRQFYQYSITGNNLTYSQNPEPGFAYNANIPIALAAVNGLVFANNNIDSAAPAGAVINLQASNSSNQGAMANYQLTNNVVKARFLSGTNPIILCATDASAEPTFVNGLSLVRKQSLVVAAAANFNNNQGFQSGDVGKSIIIQGAGRNGAPLISAIATVLSTTQILIGAKPNNLDIAFTTVNNVSGSYGTTGGGRIANNLIDGTNSGFAQGLAMTGQGVMVENNTFRGFGTGAAIVESGAADFNRYEHNKIQGGASTVTLTGTHNVARYNDGYNPRLVSVPSQPVTSPSSATNATGVDVMVYVTNADTARTVAVSVTSPPAGAQALGAVGFAPSGSVAATGSWMLPLGSTITVTWSTGAAPVWLWQGL